MLASAVVCACATESPSRWATRSADADNDGILDTDERLIGLDPRQPLGAKRVTYVAPTGDDKAAGDAAAPLRSLDEAVKASAGGEAIVVLPGTYERVIDTVARSSRVTIYGVPRSGVKPEVAGVEVWGGSFLTVRGVKITAPSQVTSHPTLKERQPAHDVEFDKVEMVVTDNPALRIRSGAWNVIVRDSWIHDSYGGIAGPNTPNKSRQITILRNRLQRFRSDAIQFGQWDDVLIQGNKIANTKDPAGKLHNDGIQFTGGSSHVIIRGNVLRDSDAQLLFVQPAFGPIDDLLVENNLIHGAGAIAVQIQGASRTRIINNTIWESAYGGLLVRGPTIWKYGVTSRDAIVANNILSAFGVANGAGVAYFGHNLLGKRSIVPGNANIVADPRFVNPKRGDFSLQPRSPAVGRAWNRYAPRIDLRGRRRARRPSVGAFEPKAPRKRG